MKKATAIYKIPPAKPSSVTTSMDGFRSIPEKLDIIAAGRVILSTIFDKT